MEHVEAFQPFIAAVDVAGDVSEGMADVKSGAAGIGEHVQDVVFGFSRIVAGLKSVIVSPILLPFLFDLGEIVFHLRILRYNRANI